MLTGEGAPRRVRVEPLDDSYTYRSATPSFYAVHRGNRFGGTTDPDFSNDRWIREIRTTRPEKKVSSFLG
jgi:hypothetical protein